MAIDTNQSVALWLLCTIHVFHTVCIQYILYICVRFFLYDMHMVIYRFTLLLCSYIQLPSFSSCILCQLHGCLFAICNTMSYTEDYQSLITLWLWLLTWSSKNHLCIHVSKLTFQQFKCCSVALSFVLIVYSVHGASSIHIKTLGRESRGQEK